MLKASGSNPYPHAFVDSPSDLVLIHEFIKRYSHLSPGENQETEHVSLAGRVMSKRASSSKLYFYDLHGGGAKLQIMADARYQKLKGLLEYDM